MKNLVILLCFLNSILAQRPWPAGLPRFLKGESKEVQLFFRDGKCDYCGLGDPENTYCKNYQGTAKRCKKVYSNEVTEEMRKEILDIHNTYRRNIANGKEPLLKDYPAADMMELVWDDELARGAQMWANQCDFRHDSNAICRYPRLGQNIYMAAAFGVPEVDWPKAILGWYEEVENYHGDPDKFAGGLGAGHFTQMIWSATEFMGCGIILSKQYQGSSRYDSSYYVCNYGPAGNFVGDPFYKVGAACSKCPDGTECKGSLCSKGTSGDTTPEPTPDATTAATTTTHSITAGPTTEHTLTTTDGSSPESCDLKTVIDYLDWCESLGVGVGHKE